MNLSDIQVLQIQDAFENLGYEISGVKLNGFFSKCCLAVDYEQNSRAVFDVIAYLSLESETLNDLLLIIDYLKYNYVVDFKFKKKLYFNKIKFINEIC